jgi:uncharacterized protein
MDRDERGNIFLAHLFTIIPLWGILFNGIMWVSFKDRSRKIVFHAHQCIFFQVVFLAAIIVGLIFNLLVKLISAINGTIGALLGFVNSSIISLIIIIYFGSCLYAMWSILQGHDFEYPFIGSKLRENSISPDSSNDHDFDDDFRA